MNTRLKELVEPGGQERVVIARRPDGKYTYFKQFRRDDRTWSAPGPDLGLYDDALTAESEARLRVPWLAADRH